MRPVEGTLLGNRYKLTSRIAVGGMGEVWKGVDSVLGREVAAKILKDEYLSESTFLARFRAEAQNMGRVSDPGIAGVYDYGDEDGSPYLVMEYVPGEALSAIIERSAPLSETDTLSIVTQAAQALGAAHKVGVIHRDIKPGNILMTPDFRVKITDFGIARVTDQAPLTKTGQVMGTAQYLAPEQATGKGSGPGSDLYALGIIAYEALAGQRPFTGDSQVAIAIAQVNQQHPPLPDTVSEPLRRFVDCLLEKKPERRPSDAFKVAKAAEALSAGDIAGAEELVPQMRHGAAASEALTQVFNNPEPAATTKTLPVTSSNDATQVYPNGAAAGIVGAGAAGAGAAAANTGQLDPNDPQNQDLEKDKQSNKGRVLIWILAIIALIAVGSLLWFFLGGGNAEPEPEPSTSAPTSEAAKTIEIDKNDYIGLTESSATQNLENKGLEVETTDINSDRAAGTVADVGEGDNGYTFEEGDTVTLYISAGPAEQPEEPASDSGSDSGLGNDSESSSDSGSSSDSQDQGSDSGSDSANSDTGSDSETSSNSSSDSETSSESDSSSSTDTSGETDSSDSGDSADASGGSNPNSGNDGAGSNSGSASSSDASGNPNGNNGNE
ncbi:protein kinase domain-containing protein [Brevibacterium linens]|uniref:non-specific serine/threonine protein kinase n=1 Tax=Brevibacterium linens TaxID=1703 RepID=A0A0B8ZWS3_BRELN|nr:protein kinase [Brevibacterium linens]KHS50922.1 serine/threonine protein kinase with PASTA sensor(s) [Brevibacterium linens]